MVEIQSRSRSPLLSKASGSLLESSQEPASGLSTRAVWLWNSYLLHILCVWGAGEGITLVVSRLHFQGWLTRAILLETADRFPLHVSAKQWAEAAWRSALEDAQGPGRRRWLIRNGSPGPGAGALSPAWWELFWNHSWVQSFSTRIHMPWKSSFYSWLCCCFVFVCVCWGGGSRINFMASQVLNFESNRVKMLENLIPLVDKIQNYLHIWGIIRYTHSRTEQKTYQEG